MNNRDYFASQLLFFCSDEDKLALRNVSKNQQSILRKTQEAPYKDRVEFILGVGGIFYDEAYLDVAWFVYYSTISSVSLKPALLYKCSDMDGFEIDGTFQKFLQGESDIKTGRVYCPGKFHAWDVNQVWLLAQLHHSRPFVIYSELNNQNVMRRNYRNVYSALTKEVSTAVKAGYTISITDEGRVQLNPDKDKPATQLSISNIEITDTDNELAIKAVNGAKNNHEAAVLAAQTAAAYLESIESEDVDQLKNMGIFFEEKVISIIEDMFVESDMKKISFNSFVKEFNLRKPYVYPDLNESDKSRNYFNVKEIDLLKNTIMNNMRKRIMEKIQYLENSSVMSYGKK